MKKQIVTKMVSAALIAGMTVGLAGCGNGEKGFINFIHYSI